LEKLGSAGYPDQTEISPPEARKITDDRAKRFYGPYDEVASTADIVIPSAPQPLSARIYTPKGQGPFPILVYFHGGGWVLGSLNSADRGARGVTCSAGCITISVDYRLAPENPFPAAVNDCLFALNWIVKNAAGFGGDPTRVAVGGDSAGGNLAAVVALEARESGPDLLFQLLIYPVVDSDLTRESYQTFANAPMLPGHRMKYFWDQYVPTEEDRMNWRCAPFHADDHSGLPPALVLAAGLDPLLDEGKEYAEKLSKSGVEVEYKVFPRMTHAFFQAPGLLDDARVALNEAGRCLRKAFG
tara:strand:+ start:1013 stop:1912 length:900 start_codon:yes stop_codon:yes gene_type:complete